MQRFSAALAVLLALVAVELRPLSAQGLTYALFERYLDSLREQAGIPGLSGLIVQNGTETWRAGLGRQEVETALPATADTPYVIGGLSQVFGSTLLLRKCVDESYLELGDRIVRWVPSYEDTATTVLQLLTHVGPDRSFRYDLTRFGTLTAVVRECAHGDYGPLLTREVFERLGMASSVPGVALASPTATDRRLYPDATLSRFAGVLRQLATPYRVDRSLRPLRSDVPSLPADAATGVVTTARDLARFDQALRAGALLDASTRQQAWSASGGAPTGQGWFVQSYNGEPLVWQFGLLRDAYSSLILKLPNRDLTLILLANSDGLSAPFALERGDVTTSPFARLLLRFAGL